MDSASSFPNHQTAITAHNSITRCSGVLMQRPDILQLDAVEAEHANPHL